MPSHTLYIDIEGSVDDIVEYAAIHMEKGRMKKVTHFYGMPENINAFWGGQRYCHGMPLRELERKGLPQAKLHEFIKKDIDEAQPAEVIGNGEDIGELLRTLDLSFLQFHNIELKHWVDRHNQKSHLQAWRARLQTECIRSVSCFSKVMHAETVYPKNIYKSVFGAHCALYDAYELYLQQNC